MSEDNRKRPCILRVLPTVDARVRAYAARQGLAPNVAAEDLINGAAAEIAALDKQLVAARDDLESAREATRRADAEVERLTRELTISEENAAAAVRLVERREAELAEARSTAPAREPCACATTLPDDLAPRLARIAARRNVEPDVMLSNVIKNGISKIEASDKYQDAQKAARGGRT